MTKDETAAFINMYIDPSMEDTDSAEIYLRDNGIDPETLQNDFGALLKKKEAQFRIADGKIFRTQFLSLLHHSREKLTEILHEDSELNMAFRKKGDLDDEDIQELLKDKEKMKLIESIINSRYALRHAERGTT